MIVSCYSPILKQGTEPDIVQSQLIDFYLFTRRQHFLKIHLKLKAFTDDKNYIAQTIDFGFQMMKSMWESEKMLVTTMFIIQVVKRTNCW